MKPNIFNLNFEELKQTLLNWGEPGYRAQQIWDGLYLQFWPDPELFTPLPLTLRDRLADHFDFKSLSPAKTLLSEDGETQKILYTLRDGSAIETVLMSYTGRNTVCISCQVGCAMDCGFCATGNMGFSRNLEVGEILEQVVKTSTQLKQDGKTLTNIVFMGMGEPFHNYSSVILNDPGGFSFGARRITISTAGLVPGIRRFAKQKSQVNLAISLHAADDRLRSSLMPVNKKYPITELLDACREYINNTHRRISIEWALIEGINDTAEQAHKLAELIKGELFHVNLIRLNPVKHYSGIPTGTDQAAAFQNILLSAGVPCTFRVRRGIDIQAGCGQLASDSK
jgi:23S rRNA (adenine2503-C2)-methyltransferase